MSRNMIRLSVCILLVMELCLGMHRSTYATMDFSSEALYSSTPIFINNVVTPNILILFSNDHTNFYHGYNSTTYDETTDYYGYFDPHKEYSYDSTNKYFTPYGPLPSNHHVTSGHWSGNYLNYLTMCHGDFVRKALTGGRRVKQSGTSWIAGDTTTGAVLERGQIPDDADHRWSRSLTSTQTGYYTGLSGGQTFTNVSTYFTDSSSNKYYVRVKVCDTSVGLETNSVCYNGGTVCRPEGLLQRFKDKANFGLMTYSYHNTDTGGVLRSNVQSVSSEISSTNGSFTNPDGSHPSYGNIIYFINNFTQKGWDPVAEMYYEAIRYFEGLETPTSRFCNGVATDATDSQYQVLCNQDSSHMWNDPISYSCQKNFIIIVNDEYPSKDGDILPGGNWPPAGGNLTDANINVTDLTGGSGYSSADISISSVGSLEGINGTNRSVGNTPTSATNTCTSKYIANLGTVRGICPSEPDKEGTFYIAGLAYYGHTVDLRPDDFDGLQNITTYAIAFRSSSNPYQVPPPPMNQLYLATKYGGFDDLNHNNIPDSGEWEGDTEPSCTPNVTYPGWNCRWPKNFTHAESGKDFEDGMEKIFTDILKQASSGTAAAVVTNSESGQGQLFQTYFEPLRLSDDGTTQASWLGFMHSLWVDPYGNFREDTNSNQHLVLTQNKIVQIRFDTISNTTVVDRYSDSNGDGVPDTTTPESTVPLSQLHPIWEASKQLSSKNPDARVIKTFADTNMDGVVASTGEFIDFSMGEGGHTDNRAILKAFLQVPDSDLDNLIKYIRGNEVSGWRNRTLGSSVYRLGDIVNSTPVAVSQPIENYDMIYGDSTYSAYYLKHKDDPTFVYVGANDGMLHAFYAGIYHSGDDSSTSGAAETAWIETQTGKTLGEEAWAYIPMNLLPHLKWLADPDYTHVYYVDLKPRVVEARIFSSDWGNPDAVHADGWGTILVCGMRFGGHPITVNGKFDGTNTVDHTFRSAYFAIDITDPTNPSLLWEKTIDDTNMGYTFSYPAVVRVHASGANNPSTIGYAEQQWLLILGNGPTDFQGDPGNNGYIYAIDLATGDLVRSIGTPSVSGTYEFMGPAAPAAANVTNYNSDVIYMGSVTKTGTAYGGKMYRIMTDDLTGHPDPNVDNWSLDTLIDPGQPITAAPAVARIDNYMWVYFGTGRYLGVDDKSNSDQQSFYGVKDPCSPYYGVTDTSSTNYGLQCSTPTLDPVVAATDLADATNIKVYETGHVEGLPSGSCTDMTQCTWNDLLTYMSTKDGFVLNLNNPETDPSERVIAKPAILGGLCLFPSFTPNPDVCGNSGSSRLFSLFYKTGTAYMNSTIGTETVGGKVLNKKVADIGTGMPSQIAIHVGKESGGIANTQMSTAAVNQQEFTPAESPKSQFIFWREVGK
jgi:type IV pilus assembly protein PilY1